MLDAGGVFAANLVLCAARGPTAAIDRRLVEVVVAELACTGALLDWVAPHGPWDDLLAFVFDGGALSGEQVAALQAHDDELAAFAFRTDQEAQERLRPYVWRRVAVAIDALRSGQAAYLRGGYRV